MKDRIRILVVVVSFLCVSAIQADMPFRNHRYDLFNTIMPPEGSIIFIGNSITDMHPWVEAFETEDGAPLPIVNRGNSGTYSTEQYDNIDSYIVNAPDKVFMMIGTNDIAVNGLNFSGTQLLEQIKKIVDCIHSRSPHTKVYLYSILDNSTPNRNRDVIISANKLIRDYVYTSGEDWLTYIDLYDKLTGVASGGSWSYDNLHLTAAAYKVWCETICRYLSEDQPYAVRTVYPDSVSIRQNNGGLGGSNGMRATYFSMLPIKEDDILFFGDEEIKNGEWNELLKKTSMKNRGTGWGYGGSIALTSGIVDATFADTGVPKSSPKAIVLYTGTDDLNGAVPMDTIKADYRHLVDKILSITDGSKIYLLSILPIDDASNNLGRRSEFNDYLRTLASDRVRVIDCLTPFLDGKVADAQYIRDPNYLYGAGYIKLSALIKDALVVDFPDIF